jgi:ribose transport system substrate-binding protein
MADGIASPDSRRDFLRSSASLGAAGALFGIFGFDPAMAAEQARAVERSSKPLKAAFSNAGLQATWCAQGKQAA